MHWRIKGVIQGLLAHAPGGTQLNDALQRRLGGRRNPQQHILDKFRGDWLVMMRMLLAHGFTLSGRDLVEVGTGWLPVLPLCFALAGARRVHCFDLHAHLEPAGVRGVLQALAPYLAELAQAAAVSEAQVRQAHARLMQCRTGLDILAQAGIHCRAPADATRTGLADGEAALVFSNSVLEHVSADVLDALMAEARRILAADGVTLHCVNCADHYAYFDRSLSPLHYLRYSSRQWRWWNNPLQFQNRLRPTDFLAAARRQGLDIGYQMTTVRPQLREDFDRRSVAAEFRHYGVDDLCATSVSFLARPPGGRSVSDTAPSSTA